MKLKHHIDQKYEEEMDFLSPKSPYGPLSQNTSKKTFLYLLATLNAVYPDYDFSDLVCLDKLLMKQKPEYFSKVPSVSLAVNAVNNSLLIHFGNSKALIEESIWSAVDQVINIKVLPGTLLSQICDVYTFLPSREMEPDGDEGNIWSFYYFFYNKPEKRIVFFMARAVRYLVVQS